MRICDHLCTKASLMTENIVLRWFTAAPTRTLTPGTRNPWQVRAGQEERREAGEERWGGGASVSTHLWLPELYYQSALRGGSRFISNCNFITGWYNEMKSVLYMHGLIIQNNQAFFRVECGGCGWGGCRLLESFGR